ILSLAQNQEKHLNHGWFVVRNRNPKEIENNISSEERQKREREFFESDPWTELPKSRRGVQALKKYLADLLCGRIQEIFPTILETIKHRQTAALSELTELGPARKTTKEKRTYLTAFAQHLHGLTSQAIRGRYHGLTNNTLKIRKHIREANDAFAAKMRAEGHCVEFQTAPIQLADRKRGMPFEDRDDLGDSQPHATSQPSLFGSQPFGGGGFGGFVPQIPKNNVGEKAPSTKGLPFQALIQKSYGSSCKWEHYQHLCVSDPYHLFSPDEIRLSDYLQEQSNPTDHAPNGGFGTSSSSFGGFGSSSSNASGFFPGFGHASNNTSVRGSFGQPPSSVTSVQQTSPSHSNSTTKPDERLSPIYIWIREEVNSSRGIELQGTLNPDVLPALFHRQIAKWKDLATSHFSKTTKTVGIALKEAIEMACKGDDVVAQRVRAQVWQAENAAEARGLLQIRQRVDEITSRHLQTQNPIFEEQIRKARLARFTAALKRYRSMTQNPIHQNGNTTDEQVVIDLRNVTALFNQVHMSSAQNLEDDIHDILKSYY
ncbi:MAG: hypothetical protein Q9180_007980, partial [Flavoplaca navasiana]